MITRPQLFKKQVPTLSECWVGDNRVDRDYVLLHEFLPKGGKIEIVHVWAPGHKSAMKKRQFMKIYDDTNSVV